MAEILCSNCGNVITYDAERPVFCSKCGQKFTESSQNADELLISASRETDLTKKHDILLEAQRLYPGTPEVEKQLLYLGRMWERGGKPDFYRIPYWPLSVFETPRLFSQKNRNEMFERFFHNPEVDRVAEMMPDKTAFIDEYMEHMAQEYVDLFIRCSTANSMFLGFRRKPEDVMRKSAGCVRTILKNIDKSDKLDTEMKMRLEWAFTRGFKNVFERENGYDYLKSIL